MADHSQQVKITRADLRGVNKDVIEVALLAIEYGWSARPRSTGGFALNCRCGEHHAYVPSGTKSGHIAKSLKANIERCPRNLGSAVVQNQVLERGKAARGVDTHLSAPVSELVGDGEPVLVSERPHMSKKGEKRGKTRAYESPVTIEQIWSDGHVSFRCKYCDFGGRATTNARSVANHSGNVHKNPENKLAQQDLVEIDEIRPKAYEKGPSTRSYNPAERLIMALADYMRDAMAADVLTPEDIAIQALRWMHERPDLGDPELRVRSSDPKTPEEQIALIRTIVDGGRYDKLEAEILSLQETLASLNESLSAAQQSEAKMRQRLERVTEELMEGL